MNTGLCPQPEKGNPLFEQFISGLAVATAVRVFAPDAVRLGRRGLAAGVMVGFAALTERGRSGDPAPRAPEPSLPAGRGERV